MVPNLSDPPLYTMLHECSVTTGGLDRYDVQSTFLTSAHGSSVLDTISEVVSFVIAPSSRLLTSIMANNHVNGTSSSSAAEDAINFYQNSAQHQPNPANTPGYKNVDSLAFEMSRVPMRTPRPLKIICVGAGISGLNIAHEVDTGGFKDCELTIYEKNSDLGGTWFENRYPG